MARTTQPSLRRKARLAAAARVAREATRPGSPGIGTRVAAIPRMIRESFAGRYPHLSRGKLALLGLGVGYVVSPIDAVPEMFLLLLGVADDIVLTMMIAGTLFAETDRFLTWEAENARRAAQAHPFVDSERVR